MIKHVCAGLTALFFAALSLQAENKVVKLPRVVATNTASVEIKQIELSDTATVLDMGAWYRPHYWIRISKDTYLRGDDGKKYPVRFGSGIKLDTEFWMPDSGTASFKLHFPACHVRDFACICANCFPDRPCFANCVQKPECSVRQCSPFIHSYASLTMEKQSFRQTSWNLFSAQQRPFPRSSARRCQREKVR